MMSFERTAIHAQTQHGLVSPGTMAATPINIPPESPLGATSLTPQVTIMEKTIPI
jgi:hypothetical protein